MRNFWYGGLLDWLGVPSSVQTQIKQNPSYSTEDEKKRAVLKYSLQTLPGMSWGRIAGVLWFLDEHTTLETVKKQLSHRPGKYANITCGNFDQSTSRLSMYSTHRKQV